MSPVFDDATSAAHDAYGDAMLDTMPDDAMLDTMPNDAMLDTALPDDAMSDTALLVGAFLDAQIARVAARCDDTSETSDTIEVEPTTMPELPVMPERYVMEGEIAEDFLVCKDSYDVEKLLLKWKEKSLNARMKYDPKFATSPILVTDKDYEFSVDPELITLVEFDPFHGYESETVVAHLTKRHDIATLFTSEEKIHHYYILKLFPFSPKDDAKTRVVTRGGRMTQEPLYPEGHPKRIEQDSQGVRTDAPSHPRKKNKDDRNLHASNPVAATPESSNDASVSDVETQSGDEHEPNDDINSDVHEDAQPSNDKDVEIEPIDLDNPQPKNRRYDKNDFAARKHDMLKMSPYAKYMKDIVTNKRRIPQTSTGQVDTH
ncbi:hypothetical protein ZWY2020_040773 [Hordeum vulgare]|nr:hypothetical protein ZWY2020_040773 [Hordeum vulgare]